MRLSFLHSDAVSFLLAPRLEFSGSLRHGSSHQDWAETLAGVARVKVSAATLSASTASSS